MKNEYFVSCSFGADSTATAILAIEKGEPLSALVYCEIMFDKEKSAEVPEHRDFIYNTAIPYFEQRGVKTIVLRAEKTAREWMEARVTKGPRKGKKHGFPLSGKKGWCSIKRDCKLPPLNKFQKEHPGAVYYEGICIDEKAESRKKSWHKGAICLSSMATRRKWRGTSAKNGACCRRSTNLQSGGGVFSARMRGTKSCGTYGSTTRICGKK